MSTLISILTFDTFNVSSSFGPVRLEFSFYGALVLAQLKSSSGPAPTHVHDSQYSFRREFSCPPLDLAPRGGPNQVFYARCVENIIGFDGALQKRCHGDQIYSGSAWQKPYLAPRKTPNPQRCLLVTRSTFLAVQDVLRVNSGSLCAIAQSRFASVSYGSAGTCSTRSTMQAQTSQVDHLYRRFQRYLLRRGI